MSPSQQFFFLNASLILIYDIIVKKKLPIDVKIIANFWAMQLLFSSTFWKKIVDIFGKATEPSVNNLVKTALVQTLRKN